jgi:hypothetical protein
MSVAKPYAMLELPVSDDPANARVRLPHQRWLLWGAWLVAWSIALLTPQPVRLAQAIIPPDSLIPYTKVLHVGAYALLTGLGGWLALTTGRWRWVLLGFLSLHALGTEFLQQFIPLRTASWGDVGLDHVGIALGLVSGWKWWRPGAGELSGPPPDMPAQAPAVLP